MYPGVGLTSTDGWNLESHYELVGSKPSTKGSVAKFASFSRTFVKSNWVMDWIDNGFDLVWDKTLR